MRHDAKPPIRPSLVLATGVVLAGVAATGVWGFRFELGQWWNKPSDHAQVEAVVTGGTLGTPGASGPDIVIIVLDTVRRDHVDLYADSDTFPELTAWSAQARVYDQAVSVSSWTLPAHASLFTGRYPISHGAHGVPLEGTASSRGLPADAPTLASALREAGWSTVGIAANKAYLHRGTGLSTGFEHWLCETLRATTRTVPYPTADRVTDMAVQLLDAPRERPVFLFLNYFDAHAPMVVRPEYTRGEIAPDLLPYTPAWNAATHALMAEHVPLPPRLAQTWRVAYDAELRFLDHHLARLFRAFPEVGIDEDDLVVVLSDHGEYFGEHDLVEHSRGVWAEGVDIPLVVRGPGFPAGRDSTPVQPNDVAAWVLDAAGLPPLPGMERTGALTVSELYHARAKDLEDPHMRERFDRVVRAFANGDGSVHLDDRGQVDLERGVPDGLEAQGAAWIAGHTAAEGSTLEVDDEQLEAMKALGYVEP